MEKLVLELYNQGLDDREMAKILDVSYTHIAQIRKLHLGLISQRDNKKIKTQSAISELHTKGMNDSQIARALGISPSSAQRHRKSLLKLPTLNPELTYETDEDRIKGYIIRNVKFSAKRRGLDFDITYRDIELVEFCPLLGFKLKYRNQSGFNDNDRATLDRIDNTKGYVKGNIHIISRLANAMKNEATFDQLELFCTNALQLVKNHRALGGITQSETVDP